MYVVTEFHLNFFDSRSHTFPQNFWELCLLCIHQITHITHHRKKHKSTTFCYLPDSSPSTLNSQIFQVFQVGGHPVFPWNHAAAATQTNIRPEPFHAMTTLLTATTGSFVKPIKRSRWAVVRSRQQTFTHGMLYESDMAEDVLVRHLNAERALWPHTTNCRRHVYTAGVSQTPSVNIHRYECTCHTLSSSSSSYRLSLRKWQTSLLYKNFVHAHT